MTRDRSAVHVVVAVVAIGLLVGGVPAGTVLPLALVASMMMMHIERAGFVLSADDERADPHDHAPGHLLAMQVRELDNNEIVLEGVR